MTLCESGTRQSPVDIPADAPVHADDATWDYRPSPISIANNGLSIQVDYVPGSRVVLDGVPYGLRQFHFHSPSEHTLAGEHAAMELHLVHWSDAGVIAVVAVMLETGGHNRGLDPIWDHMPGEPGYPVTAADVSVDAAALLPDDRSYVSYEGSLTTPPCNEGVRWHLLVRPTQLSPSQLAAFRAIYDGNNRPVQPLNDRTFD